MVASKPQIQTNPSDPPPSLIKFLHKALVVVVIIIVVPLFPSRAPDFINQSLFTRGWELVHLLFVGIAVCYGLFSRRNDQEEPQKDGSFETSVSQFLQTSSSVFDDQFETLDESSSSVQSWSSQYSRNEPVVVVAADEISSAVNGESRGMVNRSMRTRVLGLNDKPLLLPVRSLKSTKVFDSGQVDGNMSFRRSDSMRCSSEVEGGSNLVLRSPIPWRSRSGRMEEAEGFDEYASRPLDQQKLNNPKSLSPSPSIDLSDKTAGYPHFVSPELLAKGVEDGLRRKSLYKPSPPPAPPLPPPKYRNPDTPKMNLSSGRNGSRMGIGFDKECKGISSGEDSRRSVREEMMRRFTGSNLDNSLIVGKSVRTARSSESLSGLKAPREAGTEGYWKDVMEAPKEPTKSERKLQLNNQHPICDDKLDQEINNPDTRLEKDEKVVPEDIVTVESDCESESEDEDRVSDTLISFKEDEPKPVNQAIPDFGPDVDKKADEFIAKFREQIRLQRIESIKKSTYQATRKAA